MKLEQEFFTPKEVARMMGVATYTICEWVRAGRIKHVRMGRMIRIKREWADEFLEALTREPKK